MKALDHLQDRKSSYDPRMQDAIDLLLKKEGKDGRWKLQNKHAGRVYFDMEPTGKPSRWNTLRALRILKWVEEVNSGIVEK
jgi:hypothetical protein